LADLSSEESTGSISEFALEVVLRDDLGISDFCQNPWYLHTVSYFLARRIDFTNLKLPKKSNCNVVF
jgi:hypothetical protein